MAAAAEGNSFSNHNHSNKRGRGTYRGSPHRGRGSRGSNNNSQHRNHDNYQQRNHDNFQQRNHDNYQQRNHNNSRPRNLDNHQQRNQDIYDDPMEIERALMALFAEDWETVEVLEQGILSALKKLVDNEEPCTPSRIERLETRSSKLSKSGDKDEPINLERSLPSTSVVGSQSVVELKKEIIMLQAAAELKQLEFEELKKASDEMVAELEALDTKNVQNRIYVKKLEDQLSESKSNANAHLKETLSKEFEIKLDKLNELYRAEKEKCKREADDSQKKIKEAEANLTKVKEESAALLDSLFKENAELLNTQTTLTNKASSKEMEVLELMRDIMKEHCECSICLFVFEKAVTTTCGHTFCYECLVGWDNHQGGSTTCPNCRQTCTWRQIHFFDNFIVRLKERFPMIQWTKHQA